MEEHDASLMDQLSEIPEVANETVPLRTVHIGGQQHERREPADTDTADLVERTTSKITDASDAPVVRALSTEAPDMICGVCLAPLDIGPSALRLKCTDVIHYQCLLPYIREKLGDR